MVERNSTKLSVQSVFVIQVQLLDAKFVPRTINVVAHCKIGSIEDGYVYIRLGRRQQQYQQAGKQHSNWRCSRYLFISSDPTLLLSLLISSPYRLNLLPATQQLHLFPPVQSSLPIILYIFSPLFYLVWLLRKLSVPSSRSHRFTDSFFFGCCCCCVCVWGVTSGTAGIRNTRYSGNSHAI